MLSASAVGKDVPAHGFMQIECIPPLALSIHLIDLPNNATLSISIWPMHTLSRHKSLPAIASTWCSRDQCEKVKASVMFKHLTMQKSASGNYYIEFADGRKVNGSFAVTRRKQQEPVVCE